jgi:hypothetical protein
MREASTNRREAQARERAASRNAGLVFRMKSKRKTTPAASASVAARHFLMTRPPLLAVMQGGEYRLTPPISKIRFELLMS